MKISKKLLAFAHSKDCSVVPITYTNYGFHSRGFDIVKEIEGLLYIQLSIKPVRYNNGDRWYIRNYTTFRMGNAYAKNIGEVPMQFAGLEPQKTGYVLDQKRTSAYCIPSIPPL